MPPVRPAPPRFAELEARHAALRQELPGSGYLSGGPIHRRRAGQPGSGFIRSTKVKAKTVSLALSKDRADWLEKAMTEHRCVKKFLAEMRCFSSQIMRTQFADTERIRPLNKKVLRLIQAPFRVDRCRLPAISEPDGVFVTQA